MATENRNVQIVVADPTPLGLLGLSIVTLVAASQKLGITSGVSFVIPWAIFLGAIAQLFACVYDFKHNNIFGATVFGAFGLFWLGKMNQVAPLPPQGQRAESGLQGGAFVQFSLKLLRHGMFLDFFQTGFQARFFHLDGFEEVGFQRVF